MPTLMAPGRKVPALMLKAVGAALAFLEPWRAMQTRPIIGVPAPTPVYKLNEPFRLSPATAAVPLFGQPSHQSASQNIGVWAVFLTLSTFPKSPSTPTVV